MEIVWRGDTMLRDCTRDINNILYNTNYKHKVFTRFVKAFDQKILFSFNFSSVFSV